MTRYIDADALKEYIDAQKGRPFIGCTIGEALKIMTDEQPTVDAVPIEWLKCKRNEHNNDGFAWVFEAVMDDWRNEKDL